MIRKALDVAASATSKPRERYAAAAVFDCIRVLGDNMGYFAQGLTELRAAVRESRPAALSGRQVRSIEDFATCAQEVARREGTQIVADAAVGSGVPTVFLLGLLAL